MGPFYADSMAIFSRHTIGTNIFKGHFLSGDYLDYDLFHIVFRSINVYTKVNQTPRMSIMLWCKRRWWSTRAIVESIKGYKIWTNLTTAHNIYFIIIALWVMHTLRTQIWKKWCPMIFLVFYFHQCICSHSLFYRRQWQQSPLSSLTAPVLERGDTRLYKYMRAIRPSYIKSVYRFIYILFFCPFFDHFLPFS